MALALGAGSAEESALAAALVLALAALACGALQGARAEKWSGCWRAPKPLHVVAGWFESIIASFSDGVHMHDGPWVEMEICPSGSI